MTTIIAKNCPHCGRAKKDHTRWQKEACGKILSENYKPLPPEKRVVLPERK